MVSIVYIPRVYDAGTFCPWQKFLKQSERENVVKFKSLSLSAYHKFTTLG